MTDINQTNESTANTLCKSCGLCCTGHLFTWTKLRSVELAAIQGLGLNVFREPGHRGFNQPCPLWDGQCTIYSSPQYPRFCRAYKCKLLKKVLDEITSLPQALKVVEQAKGMINELDSLLPASTNPNFRERLVAFIENENSGSDFRLKAENLLAFYETQFGVNDLIEKPDG